MIPKHSLSVLVLSLGVTLSAIAILALVAGLAGLVTA